MRKIFALVIAVSIFAMSGAAFSAAGDFQEVTSPRQWSFPRDHGRHDGFKLEWWYFTGNLHDSSGRRFGYQLTFFRSAYAPLPTSRPSGWGMNDLYFAHAAISEIDGKAFVYKDRLERARPGLAFASDKTLDVSLLDWSAKLVDGKIQLLAKEDQFAIELTCGDGRGPFLEGPGGVNTKGHQPGQASYYYSMTRLKTAGVLTVKGQRFTVDGLSWMDHEFSSHAMAKNQVGWDWMGLQLDDGTDLMIYRLRDSAGKTDYLSGTKVMADGQPRYLSDREISIAGDEVWKSPASGADYPQRWAVSIAGLAPLQVRSEMPGQELMTNGSTKVTYFEGASDILDPKGKVVGRGYLEMTGYTPKNE